MKDYNFFEPYVVKENPMNIKRFIQLAALIIIPFTAIFYPVMNILEINSIKDDIAIVNNSIQMLEPQMQDIAATQQEIHRLNGINERLEEIHHLALSADNINEEFFTLLEESIPRGISFDALRFSKDTGFIDGKAVNKEKVAEFRFALSQRDNIEEVFVHYIREEENVYSFSLEFLLKDVNGNE